MARHIENTFDPPEKLAALVTDQWILQQAELLSKHIDEQIKRYPAELDSGKYTDIYNNAREIDIVGQNKLRKQLYLFNFHCR